MGQKEKFNVIITESMIDTFARLSGDFNPLHMDKNYCKTTTLKKRVAHGMLVASLFSRLVGMHLPGKQALYFSQDLKFMNPCFINDELVIEGEVIKKMESTKIITLKTTVFNMSGKCIIDGECKILVR